MKGTKQKFFGACFQTLIEHKYAGLLEQKMPLAQSAGKYVKNGVTI